jgi:hypothetical protein
MSAGWRSACESPNLGAPYLSHRLCEKLARECIPSGRGDVSDRPRQVDVDSLRHSGSA